ncbi:LysR family transcriptional regulator [Bradyrhizobium genosp. L]|uniref:LysR family transcriptional regulator n=1 Tax=Bradyrhizobium genosp. L TaxID=83637 RepID=UPI0018A28A0D|nr:LysR family transcriptional regulator [Bradyrhizobium genosp. L]QPF82121.1 LysR family transcriptional regulator [Bradyrhizobium genosp. L]
MIRDLKLRQLRLLVALDDARKLQLAAERLNITQSAASKMLAEIEAVARVPLFERTARGVEPTEYGAILVRGGRSVLADLDQVTDEFAGYKSGELGTVSVGTVARACADLVIDVMQYLGNKLDRVNISLDVSTSPPLVERLLALEFDFVIARIPAGVDPGQFDYHEIGAEEAALLVRAEHPLACRDSVDLAEMIDLQWICQPRESFLRQALERLFYSRGVTPPRRVINTESFFASIGIAAGIDAIVPVPMLVFDLVDPQRFKRLRIKDQLMLESYGLMKLRKRKLSPAAMLVFDAMLRLGVPNGAPASGSRSG